MVLWYDTSGRLIKFVHLEDSSNGLIKFNGLIKWTHQVWCTHQIWSSRCTKGLMSPPDVFDESSKCTTWGSLWESQGILDDHPWDSHSLPWDSQMCTTWGSLWESQGWSSRIPWDSPSGPFPWPDMIQYNDTIHPAWYDMMRHSMIRHDTIQFDMIPYATRCNTLQHTATSYDMMRHNMIRHDTIQFDMIWYKHDATWYHMIWHDTIQHDTTWYDMIRHDAIQFDMTWCDTPDVLRYNLTWHNTNMMPHDTTPHTTTWYNLIARTLEGSPLWNFAVWRGGRKKIPTPAGCLFQGVFSSLRIKPKDAKKETPLGGGRCLRSNE